MTKVTILGRPIAKKNSKRLFRAGGRMIVFPSAAYERFKRDALLQLRINGVKKVAGDVSISYNFYFKGKMWLDFDNAMASINDILTEAGVIDDDRNILSGSFSVTKGCKDWETILVITKHPIDIVTLP